MTNKFHYYKAIFGNPPDAQDDAPAASTDDVLKEAQVCKKMTERVAGCDKLGGAECVSADDPFDGKYPNMVPVEQHCFINLLYEDLFDVSEVFETPEWLALEPLRYTEQYEPL